MRSRIWSWSLFDFANTGFYVIMITLVFPVYFNGELAGGDESVWGMVISISMLVTALIGPVLGSIADASGRVKLFLGIFTGATIAATVALFFGAVPGALVLASVLIIVANVGFEGGTIFYDALLPRITTRETITRVSAFGWGVGYAGSFLTLGLVMFILGDNSIANAGPAGTALATYVLGFDPGPEYVRSTFLIAAAIFAVFAIPLFLKVPDAERPATPGEKISLVEGYRRLGETFRNIRNYRDVVAFLLAFFFYNDGILTVIAMAAIFMDETLGFDTTEKIIFFMVVQATALIGSLIFGRVAERIGPRATIMITLAIWIAVVIAAYFVESATGFYVVGALAGLALGSSQSTSRTMMALLTPEDRTTEFFGFYDGFFGKASAIVGPAAFGALAVWLGQRPAMLLIGVMFVVGALLLMRVPDVRGEVRSS